MIRTETYLFTRRAKNELQAIKAQLKLLYGMLQDDCLDAQAETAMEVVNDVQKAARNLDNLSTGIWLKLNAVNEKEAENEPVQPGL